jgi:hypothetical protein
MCLLCYSQLGDQPNRGQLWKLLPSVVTVKDDAKEKKKKKFTLEKKLFC